MSLVVTPKGQFSTSIWKHQPQVILSDWHGLLSFPNKQQWPSNGGGSIYIGNLSLINMRWILHRLNTLIIQTLLTTWSQGTLVGIQKPTATKSRSTMRISTTILPFPWRMERLLFLLKSLKPTSKTYQQNSYRNTVKSTQISKLRSRQQWCNNHGLNFSISILYWH